MLWRTQCDKKCFIFLVFSISSRLNLEWFQLVHYQFEDRYFRRGGSLAEAVPPVIEVAHAILTRSEVRFDKRDWYGYCTTFNYTEIQILN